MTVKRYRLRILFQSQEKGAWDEELDLDNKGRLREVLVDAADRYNRTGSVRDYSEWRLDVHRLERNRADHKGPRLAMVTVDGAGRTVVDR